jgi:mRNA-degrading endonuclease YafQ of YafQ-DinJ toxin-antitoxin module
MIESQKEDVEWELAAGFRDSWKRYLKVCPGIKTSMTEFNRCKRTDASTPLPGKMKDHKLDGPLKGFMDCHLDDDIILIYKPIASGGIRLFLLCEHSDLTGPKAKSLRKRLGK